MDEAEKNKEDLLAELSKRNYQKIRGLTWLMVYLSGAYIPVLERAPSDIGKQARVGTLILIVGLLSGFSMLIALQDFFYDLDQRWNFWSIRISHVIAVLWAILIINIDILATTSISMLDNKKERWSAAASRLMLALAISFAISMPLETVIFQKDIQQATDDHIETEIQKFTAEQDSTLSLLRVKKAEMITQRDAFLLQSGDADAQFSGSQQEISRLQVELAEYEASTREEVTALRLAYNEAVADLATLKDREVTLSNQLAVARDFVDSLSLKDQQVLLTQEIRQKQLEVNRKKDEVFIVRQPAIQLRKQIENQSKQATTTLTTTKGNLNQLIAKIDGIENQILREDSLVSVRLDSMKASLKIEYDAKLLTNFPFKLKKLHELVGIYHGEWNSSSWLYIAVVLLVFAIESLPVFLKAITGPGAYDKLNKLRKEEEEEAQKQEKDAMHSFNKDNFQELVDKQTERNKEFRHRIDEKIRETLDNRFSNWEWDKDERVIRLWEDYLAGLYDQNKSPEVNTRSMKSGLSAVLKKYFTAFELTSKNRSKWLLVVANFVICVILAIWISSTNPEIQKQPFLLTMASVAGITTHFIINDQNASALNFLFKKKIL